MSNDEPKLTIFISSMIGPLWNEWATVEAMVCKLLDAEGQGPQVAELD